MEIHELLNPRLNQDLQNIRIRAIPDKSIEVKDQVPDYRHPIYQRRNRKWVQNQGVVIN